MRWQRIWVDQDDAAAYRLFPIQADLGERFAGLEDRMETVEIRMDVHIEQHKRGY